GEPPRDFKKMMLAGFGVAVAAGLVFGLLARPSFKESPRVEAAARSAPATVSNGQLDIQVSKRVVPPPQVTSAGGKLETMSGPPLVETANPQPRAQSRSFGQMAAGMLSRLFGGSSTSRTSQAADPVQRPAPAQPRIERVEQVQPAPDAEPAFEQADYPDDPPMEAPMFQPRPAPPPQRATFQPTARPSFNCQYARTRAERMVCTDPELAAADRRLARAFRNAVDNGVPERALRAQQDRWLRAREQAAVDPEAVAMVYEARIRELEDMGY
ncbi:MAG: hypothetical protein ACXWVH_00155, partial [Caulobacteraceae bacterium]